MSSDIQFLKTDANTFSQGVKSNLFCAVFESVMYGMTDRYIPAYKASRNRQWQFGEVKHGEKVTPLFVPTELWEGELEIVHPIQRETYTFPAWIVWALMLTHVIEYLFSFYPALQDENRLYEMFDGLRECLWDLAPQDLHSKLFKYMD